MAKRKVSKKRVARKRVTRRKPIRRRIASKAVRSPRKKKSTRRATRRRKKRAPAPKVLKAVERVSVERTLAGKKKKKRRRRKPAKVRSRSRRRSVSGKGSGLLVGLAIGAGAYLLLSSMNRQPTTGYQYPTGQLLQTNNVTRNTQSQDILNYALAAGLAVNAIAGLIDKLNTSSDSDVKSIYDHVVVSGGDPYVYV